MIDIAAIRARAEAAQPGPWLPYCDHQDDLYWLANDKDYASIRDAAKSYVAEFHVGRTEEERVTHTVDPINKPIVAANILFIAAARTDVPTLCDRVDAMQRAFDGFALVGVRVTERDEGSWAINNERALKAEARVAALEKALRKAHEYAGCGSAPGASAGENCCGICDALGSVE